MAAASARYDRARVACLRGLIVALALSCGYVLVRTDAAELTAFLFYYQDLMLLPLLAAMWLLRIPAGAPASSRDMRPPYLAAAAAIAFAGVVCWFGRGLVFEHYDLSRDEQMAVFDAAVFVHGVAPAPIAPAWRAHADALNLMYMQTVGAHEAWLSNYLPVNAMIRAAFGRAGLSDLASPALVVVGLACLGAVARRIWPDRPIAAPIAIMFAVASPQLLATGMTAYAMNAYFALNLLWLYLFLRGGGAGHGGAIAVGALATGIHQPLFHPLFVLPFLDMLRRQRRWRLLGVYVLAYAAIGCLWLAWPYWIAAHAAGAATAGGGAVGFLDRARGIFDPRPVSVVAMAMNLIRFVTWQHLLLLPLAGLAVATGWRRDPLTRALALGVLLPVLAALVLMPTQGHGWGYRYLHGAIGNLCLLATSAVLWLRDRRAAIGRPLAIATAASLLLLLPVRLAMAHRMVAPYAMIDREIASLPADVVIVEDRSAPFGTDLVLNRPNLSNRPIRLAASQLDARQVAAICRRYRVVAFDAPRLAAAARVFGDTGPRRPSRRMIALERVCTVTSRLP